MSSPVFRLEHLFGSQTRARLLGLFLLHPGEAFFVRELTRRIDAQLNSVRRELKNLMDLGLVLERAAEGKKLADRKKFYQVNPDSVLYPDLRNLFAKLHVLLKQNMVEALRGHGTISYLVFTGRFVGRADVPTDILVVGDLDPQALGAVVEAFEKELGHEVNYTLLSRDEFDYRRQVADRFLLSIVDGQKIVMVDEI